MYRAPIVTMDSFFNPTGGDMFIIYTILAAFIVLMLVFVCQLDFNGHTPRNPSKKKIFVKDTFHNPRNTSLSQVAATLSQKYILKESSVVTIHGSILLGSDENCNEMKVINALKEIANVFFVCKCTTVEDDAEFGKLGTLFDIPKHRILTYETEKGKHAIIRQLQPRIHIDDDLKFQESIKLYITHSIYVGPTSDSSTSRSLSDIFL